MRCASKRRTKWILGNVQNNYRNMTVKGVYSDTTQLNSTQLNSTELNSTA